MQDRQRCPAGWGQRAPDRCGWQRQARARQSPRGAKGAGPGGYGAGRTSVRPPLRAGRWADAGVQHITTTPGSAPVRSPAHCAAHLRQAGVACGASDLAIGMRHSGAGFLPDDYFFSPKYFGVDLVVSAVSLMALIPSFSLPLQLGIALLHGDAMNPVSKLSLSATVAMPLLALFFR